MTTPATQTDLQAQIDQHDAVALALEAAAVAASAGLIRRQVQSAMAAALAQWQRAFRDFTGRQSGPKFARIVDDLSARLRGIPVDPQAALLEYAQKARVLGVRQGAVEAGVPPVELPARLEFSTHTAVAQTVTDAREKLAKAPAMLDTLPYGSFTTVQATAGPATQAANIVERAASTVVNTELNNGITAVADSLGAQRVWVAERDACFIPSTRVLAPSAFTDGPSASPELVATNPLNGLPLDPSTLGVALVGDPSLPAAPAVAKSVRDRFGEVKAVTSREYVGDVVDIRTASGKELTGTPNHPIATRGGWVALGELKVGDYVFSRTSTERPLVGVHPDDNDAPPSIEEVAEAFPVPVRVVPTAAEDFHGDGAGSEVHVVRTDRLLRNEIDPACPEHGGEFPLDRGDVQLLNLAGESFSEPGAVGPLPASVGANGSLRDGLAPLGAELMGSTEVLPDGQVVPLEPPPDRVHVDTVDHSYFVGRLAGMVEPDEIVEVRRRQFSGHVINLETIEGWYLAEGIVAHNCVTCLALSGSVVNVGESFDLNATFGAKPMTYVPIGVGGLTGPPRHPNCRCRCSPWLGQSEPGVIDFPTALRREAERSVLKGFARPSESERVRTQAADRLLQLIGSGSSPSGWQVPKSVRTRARNSIDKGTFRTGPVPTGRTK